MPKVVSLQIAKMLRPSGKQTVAKIPTDFDARDVRRLTQDDEVARMDDPVVFGATAGAQIRAMCAAVGQTEIPQTFAQLFGMHHFVVLIKVSALGVTPEIPEVIRQKMLAHADADMPGLSELLKCLLDGRMDDAAQWHREHRSLQYWGEWYASTFAQGG